MPPAELDQGCRVRLRFHGSRHAWDRLGHVLACGPFVLVGAMAAAAAAWFVPGLAAGAAVVEAATGMVQVEPAAAEQAVPADDATANAAPAANDDVSTADEESTSQDPVLWRRVRAFRLVHASPRDLRSLVLLAAGADRGAAQHGESLEDDETVLGNGGRARPAGEQVLRMAVDVRRRLLLVRADEEQLARVERLISAFDVPAAELPEGEVEGLLAVRLRHARPLDVVNVLRELDLHDASLLLHESSLLVVRVRRGARQQAGEAIRALDMP